MAGRCATEQYAKNIGGKGTAVANRLCTATRATNIFGCNVASGYSGNRIVVQSALSAAGVELYVCIECVMANAYFCDFELGSGTTWFFSSYQYRPLDQQVFPTEYLCEPITKGIEITKVKVGWYQGSEINAKYKIAAPDSPIYVNGGELLTLRLANNGVLRITDFQQSPW